MPSILVIEDDAANADLLRIMLEAEGHRVLHSTDGASGLETARTEPLDLVILDKKLEGPLDGAEVARLIRAAGFTGPIICQTGCTSETDRERCLSAGADAFLAKPFRRQDLLALVERLLGGGS